MKICRSMEFTRNSLREFSIPDSPHTRFSTRDSPREIPEDSRCLLMKNKSLIERFSSWLHIPWPVRTAAEMKFKLAILNAHLTAFWLRTSSVLVKHLEKAKIGCPEVGHLLFILSSLQALQSNNFFINYLICGFSAAPWRIRCGVRGSTFDYAVRGGGFGNKDAQKLLFSKFLCAFKIADGSNRTQNYHKKLKNLNPSK